MSKQHSFYLVGLALIMAALVVGCQSQSEATPTPLVTKNRQKLISVTGELVPGTWASLSAQIGGTVVEVLVEPGTTVSSGTALVVLDTADLDIALDIARQQLATQQALLAQRQQGASEAVKSRADRDAAYQLEQAQIMLLIQEAQLEQAQLQNPTEDISISQAQIKQIEAQQAQLQAQSPRPDIELAQIELERAQIALDDTKDEYNKALDRPWEDQAIRDAWADQLEQARLNYRSAQAQVQRAQNGSRAYTAGLGTLDAQMEAAQASLEKGLAAQQAYSVTLTMLNYEIEATQLQIEHLSGWENPYRDPASDEEIAQLEAAVEQAQLQIEQIEQQIQDATITAPFDGTVGAVYVRNGELVSPGQPMVILGDLDSLQVETTDLDEIDIANITLDQQATVTFDAFADQLFSGRVIRISPMAEPSTGGVNYTIVIKLDELNPSLRWGMTAFVDIEIK